jgi:hypothetical protein
MRKCCCCIPILGGATLIGFIALVLCALEFVVTIPYLAGIDVDTFNPIQNNLKYMYDQIEYTAKQVTNDTEQTKGIMTEVQEYTWKTIMSEAVSTGIYFIISLMMICGIQCDMRGLMIPYMVIQMLYIILAIIIGVAVTVLFFYYNLIMGIVSAAVVLILSFLFIYFWVAVQKVKKCNVQYQSRDIFKKGGHVINCKFTEILQPGYNH